MLDKTSSKVLILLTQDELQCKTGNWGSAVTAVYKPEQLNQFYALVDLEYFNDMVGSCESYLLRFATDDHPELMVCPLISDYYTNHNTVKLILIALITRILRPDRLSDCILLLKEEVGTELLIGAENNIVAALEAVKSPKDEFVVCLTTPG